MSTVWPNTTDAFTTKTDGTIVYASHMNKVLDKHTFYHRVLDIFGEWHDG